MARWFWNFTVFLNGKAHSVAGADINGMNLWLFFGGLLFLAVGLLFNSGINESPIINSDKKKEGKTFFFSTLAFVLFPIDAGWCHYKLWYELNGTGHFFAWIFFLLFLVFFLIKVINIVKLISHHCILDALLKLMSICMIYIGVVIFSKWLGIVFIVIIAAASIISPSDTNHTTI
jgi:hypothetical protein